MVKVCPVCEQEQGEELDRCPVCGAELRKRTVGDVIVGWFDRTDERNDAT